MKGKGRMLGIDRQHERIGSMIPSHVAAGTAARRFLGRNGIWGTTGMSACTVAEVLERVLTERNKSRTRRANLLPETRNDAIGPKHGVQTQGRDAYLGSGVALAS